MLVTVSEEMPMKRHLEISVQWGDYTQQVKKCNACATLNPSCRMRAESVEAGKTSE